MHPPMLRRRLMSSCLLAGAACLAIVTTAMAAGPLKPLNVPRDRSAWAAQREAIRKAVLDALGPLPPRPEVKLRETEIALKGAGVTLHANSFRVGVRNAPRIQLREVRFQPDAGRDVRALVAAPAVESRERSHTTKRPAILYLSDGPERPHGAWETGPDGQQPGLTLAQRGFLVFAADSRFAPSSPDSGAGSPWLATGSTPSTGPSEWALSLRDDQAALDALLSLPEVDPKRVAVFGVGPTGGMRAWWLLALDERLKCGVAAGGITRYSDWLAAQKVKTPALEPWAKRLLETYDSEAVMALCPPRLLQIFDGDRDRLAPERGFVVCRDTMRRVYRLLNADGPGATLFGDHDGRFTRLIWDSALETFDKQLMPQGPTPLGHSPEPEPTVTPEWVNPIEHGLAGWVVEMSQRPGTWTWHDGVITCKPGPFEYGWLRLPAQLDDFELQLEWKVEPKGNTGIFLRARPVDWTMPPTEKNKACVITLGETWPSRTGLELQAQDDPGHADKYSSGSLYRHAAPAANPTKPPGEWNRYTVRCRGARVEVWINGDQVLDTRIDQYLTLREPPLSGYIGLQNHGAPAQFRNIRYRKLGAGAS